MTRASRGRHARTYAYTLVTSAIVMIFALAEWCTERFISDRSRAAGTAIEASIVLAAALIFRPIHQRVEAAIEDAFSRRKRRAFAALAKFRREITSFADAGQLLRRVVEAIEHYLEARACAIYLRREAFHAEVSTFDVPAEDVALDDPLAVRLRSSGLAARSALLTSAARGTHAFPMTVAGEVIGFLAVDCMDGECEPDEARVLCDIAEETARALVTLDSSLRPAKARTNNLPAHLSVLIGRENELAEVTAALEQSRLLTLTGAGGVGKTRLALQIAAQAQAPDGAWFVDLSPINNPGLVATEIGAVFGIVDEGGKRPAIERVAAALQDRDVLIVLDNCEHVISSAAPAAAVLLERCPRVRILATSREPLGLPAEHRYRMPSLPVPGDEETLTAEDSLRYDAVALFVARARAANPAFELTDLNATVVADIVRRVDGIAMAIELAASRVRVMALQQIEEHLNERFKLLTGGARTALPRHQTLHALIGWSYDLLDERERAMLRRLSVFRGDWTLEAAHAVYAPDVDRFETLDLLQALADKSLLAVRSSGDDSRYRLPESTRQFAEQKLNEAVEAKEAHQRHCRYFASLAQRYGDAYWRTDSDAWTALLREDLENFRAAIAWGFSEEGDARTAASIVADLRWFWYATARREGHDLVERAAGAEDTQRDPRSRGFVALAAAVLDTSAQATRAATEAMALLYDVDQAAYAEALAFEGTALGRAGHVDQSVALFSQALTAARITEAPRLIGWVLTMAAYWREVSGDDSTATELFDEAAQVLRSCGDPWQLARLQLHRAEFYFAHGELGLALACVLEAESVFRARKYETGLCVATLNACAYVLAMGRLRDGWERAREGLELAGRLDNEMAFAWAIGHLAEVAAETGKAAMAARLLGCADAIYANTGSEREPTEQRGYVRAREILRLELPPEEVARLTLEGAQVRRDLIVRDAMAIPQPQAGIASAAPA